MLLVGVFCAAVLFAVVAVVVTGVVTEGVDGATKDDDEALPGHILVPSYPAGVFVSPTPPPTTTTTTTTTRTPIKELVCTIGAYVVQSFSYPPDGLCHYLFYYKLFITKDGTLHGTSEDLSWHLYKQQMPTYRTTKGGMAFDNTYVNMSLVHGAAVRINELAQNDRNIANYGVLNIISRGTKLESQFTKAKRFLEELKRLQKEGEDRKIFIGMGLYAFNEDDGLNTFKNIFRRAVNDSNFYTVFAITSITAMPDRDTCTVQPAGERRLHSNVYPAIDNYKDLLTNDSQYGNELAIVGASLQMGAMMYTLKKDFTGGPSAELINERCDEASITSPEMVCKGYQVSNTGNGRFGFVHSANKIRVFLMEDENSILAKADIKTWENPTIISRFSWLVFNIHFDQSLKACAMNSNFYRLRFLKSAFNIP
ncbi:uncharacterized protein LOC144149216 [Haemaphysalis longicornis]